LAELYSTGVDFIDVLLGGGVQPGTLTVVRGATGAGKTQLGLSFCNAGLTQEGRRGFIIDMGSRGDSQQHAAYAARLFDWHLHNGKVDLERVWDEAFEQIDYLNPFGYVGKRVLRDEVNDEQWRAFKLIVVENLRKVLAHGYYHFVHGVQRVLVDGVEPFERARESVQIELFEYILHQIVRKPHDWAARDLFQGQWLQVKDQVAAHPYDHTKLATMFLQTTPETELHQLIAAQTMEDDLTTNATTIILMGRMASQERVERGVFVLKHRGAWCSDEIVRYTITGRGLERVG
jgi:KaiC/GvpD/RAD55 family RecA-like ATPase